MNSRRIFLRNAALTSGALMSSNLFASSSIFNTDTLRVATIGVNGMGWANTLGALSVKNVEVVALCDIDESVLNKRKAELLIKQPSVTKIDTYSDYRKILDRKDSKIKELKEI